MRISILLLALALSACNTPLSTQWKLRGFSLKDADLSQLRMAIREPEWARGTPERGQISVVLKLNNGEERKATLRLRPGRHPEDLRALEQLSHGSFAIYELAPDSLVTGRALQVESDRLTASGVHGNGFIAPGDGLACRLKSLPDGVVPLDFYIHANDELGWLVLAESYDLREKLSSAETLREFEKSVPLCAKENSRPS
jgi:hypothetical protein